MPNCPICESALGPAPRAVTGPTDWIGCPRCGNFGITHNVLAELTRRPPTLRARAVLSYHLRGAQRGTDLPVLNSSIFEEVLRQDNLPTPLERTNNMLLFIGDRSETLGGCKVDPEKIAGLIGAIDSADVIHAVRALDKIGLLTVSPSHLYALTLNGWAKYEELKKGRYIGTKAFMAMKFGDEGLDDLYRAHIKPAVSMTGFDLIRLDENPHAGLIDDRLRVEIRNARFLIADLTHANNGAYWEAGYAEGLGKPVIYTCSHEQFEQQSTHFDTNHHLTVTWDQDNLPDFVERLKATIRATIPEANREDPE